MFFCEYLNVYLPTAWKAILNVKTVAENTCNCVCVGVCNQTQDIIGFMPTPHPAPPLQAMEYRSFWSLW